MRQEAAECHARPSHRLDERHACTVEAPPPHKLVRKRIFAVLLQYPRHWQVYRLSEAAKAQNALLLVPRCCSGLILRKIRRVSSSSRNLMRLKRLFLLATDHLAICVALLRHALLEVVGRDPAAAHEAPLAQALVLKALQGCFKSLRPPAAQSPVDRRPLGTVLGR